MSGGKMPETYWGKLFFLFWNFLKIASVVVGGGLAILPVVQDVFSKRFKLLSDEELLDMTALVQTTPGIIAGNSAVYVGMKTAGFGGAAAALLGAGLPSFAIILFIAMLFPALRPDNAYVLGAFAGVRACITGLIIVTAFKFARRTLTGYFEFATAAAAVAATVFLKINPAYVILASFPLGMAVTSIRMRKAIGEKDLK